MYAMIGYHNIFSSGFDDFWGNPLGKRSIKQPQDFILDDCIPWGFLQNFEYILNNINNPLNLDHKFWEITTNIESNITIDHLVDYHVGLCVEGYVTWSPDFV